MQSSRRCLRLLIAVVVIVISGVRVFAQAGFDDDRVMLQGFYWESYRHGTDRFVEAFYEYLQSIPCLEG